MHTDQGPVFRNELFSDLSRLFKVKYSKEENGIIERANEELMRHRRAMILRLTRA